MSERFKFQKITVQTNCGPREIDAAVLGDSLRAEVCVTKLGVELETLKRIATDLHWMARRYADGRRTYATSMFNEHTRELLKLGVTLNPTGDGTIWARDGDGRACDGLSDEEAAMGRPLGEFERYADEDVKLLREERDALREALEFYAKEIQHDGGEFFYAEHPLGSRARAALARFPRKEGA